MNKVTKVMSVSFVSNVSLSLLKVIIGTIGHSTAIVADGAHSFSDLLTDLVAIIGNKMSLKPADKEHPYGHGQLEYLTSLAIGTAVLFIAFTIITSAVFKTSVIPSSFVMWVSLFTIITKYILAKYISIRGIEYNNAILKASGRESMGDVISSIFVLISAVMMQLTHYVSWFIYADAITTIIVGLFIFRIGFLIIKDNISTIIEERELDPILNQQVTNIILNNSNVKKIDSLIIIKSGPYYKLMIELQMSGNGTLNHIHKNIDLIEKNLKKANRKYKYIMIHVSPAE